VPFAPALHDHVYALLSLCQDTAEAAAEASEHAGHAATAIGAPSQVLATARTATQKGRDTSPGLQSPAAGEPAFTIQPRELTSTVQNALHGLGITSPALLQRAADIDHAAEQLILHAAEQRGLHHNPPNPAPPYPSASTPALLHYARTLADPRIATPPHHTALDQQPEAEP
jgi:hypothetical protein